MKLPGSSPSNDEVKNAQSYTSSLPHDFMAWCLINYRIKCLKILDEAARVIMGNTRKIKNITQMEGTGTGKNGFNI
jgi:hypothetical protein